MKTPVTRAPDDVPFSQRVLPPQSKRTGRPTDLTTDIARKICVAIWNGCYRYVAAAFCRVHESRMSAWMNANGEPYETFQKWVEEAEAAAELRAVQAVTSRMNGDPKLAVTFLERKFPERWAKVVAMPGSPVNVNLNLTTMLQTIEARGRSVRDPRPPLPGQRTILDVIAEARDDAAASRKQPVALMPAPPNDTDNTNEEDGADDAEP